MREINDTPNTQRYKLITEAVEKQHGKDVAKKFWTNVEKRNHVHNSYPLKSATTQRKINTIELLLEKDDPHRARDKFIKAVKKKHVDVIQLFLKHGIDLNRFDSQEKEETILHCAARMGHIDIVELFLQHGVNLEREASVFEFAAQNGHIDLIKLLLKYRGNSKLKLSQAISLAISNNQHIDIIKLLFEHAADLNLEKYLKIAISNGHIDALKLLLNHGGISNSKLAEVTYSAIVDNQHIDITKLLLDYHRSISNPELNQKTLTDIAYWAISANRIAIVKVLLEYGMNPNDYLEFATSLKYTDIVNLLLEYGANPYANSLYTYVAAGKKKIIDSFHYLKSLIRA